jgi:mannose/fructose/N-acetylgalactosamine-specific phosphotransferase system component IIB
VRYRQSSEAEDENISVIAKYPEDGLALVEAGLQMETLNLGNQASVRGSRKLSNTVYLTESGVKPLKSIHEKAIRTTCRMMPSSPKTESCPTVAKAFPDWVS